MGARYYCSTCLFKADTKTKIKQFLFFAKNDLGHVVILHKPCVEKLIPDKEDDKVKEYNSWKGQGEMLWY